MNEVEGHPSVDDDGDCVIDDTNGASDEGEPDRDGMGNLADDEGHNDVPFRRKRNPSERIIKQKLKKIVYDKNGSTSSAANPINLE